MGYTTEFQGEFKLNKPLSEADMDFLIGLAATRRMARDLAPEFGIEGEFYVDSRENYGQNRTPDIIDYNRPPKTQPSLWCQWVPTDPQTIEWDGGEKFYRYVEWLKYIIDKILKPKGYVMSGSVQWRGEDFSDYGTITVKDNFITTSNDAY